MRLTIDYEMDGNKLPRDYLRGFMSLVKEIIKKEDSFLFEQYFKKHKLKPFTFGVYFPELKGNDGEMLNVGSKLKFNFSTSSLELVTYFYNGYQKIKDYPIFNNKISPKHFTLHKNLAIIKGEIIFKTLSPFLVNNLGESNKFLFPYEDGFMEGLKFSVNECVKEFLGKEKIEIEFEPLAMKRKVIYHYQKMPTNVGVFKLKAEPEVLKMIYDIGIGVHRSQGFGMLEVVG